MDATHATNDEQARLWNGAAGRAWAEAQELLDQVLKPFERLLVYAVADGSRRQVLDVGCGTGSTTLAVARLLGQRAARSASTFLSVAACRRKPVHDDR